MQEGSGCVRDFAEECAEEASLYGRPQEGSVKQWRERIYGRVYAPLLLSLKHLLRDLREAECQKASDLIRKHHKGLVRVFQWFLIGKLSISLLSLEVIASVLSLDTLFDGREHLELCRLALSHMPATCTEAFILKQRYVSSLIEEGDINTAETLLMEMMPTVPAAFRDIKAVLKRDYAAILTERLRFHEAEKILSAVVSSLPSIQLFDVHEGVAAILDLAQCYFHLGRNADVRKTLQLLKEQEMLDLDQWRYRELVAVVNCDALAAEQELRELLSRKRAIWGQHPFSLQTWKMLALTFWRQRRFIEALEEVKQIIPITQRPQELAQLQVVQRDFEDEIQKLKSFWQGKAVTIMWSLDACNLQAAAEDILSLICKKFGNSQLPQYTRIEVDNESPSQLPELRIYDDGFYFIHLNTADGNDADVNIGKYCLQLAHTVCHIFLGAFSRDPLIEVLCCIMSVIVTRELAALSSSDRVRRSFRLSERLYFSASRLGKLEVPHQLIKSLQRAEFNDVLCFVKRQYATEFATTRGVPLLVGWCLLQNEQWKLIKWPRLLGIANPEYTTKKDPTYPSVRYREPTCPWFYSKADAATKSLLSTFYALA